VVPYLVWFGQFDRCFAASFGSIPFAGAAGAVGAKIWRMLVDGNPLVFAKIANADPARDGSARDHIFCRLILRLFKGRFQSVFCFRDHRALAAPVNAIPAPPLAFGATVGNLFGIPFMFAVWPFTTATVDSFGDLFNRHVFISLR